MEGRMEGENGSLVRVLLLYGCVRAVYVRMRGSRLGTASFRSGRIGGGAASEGRHHHIVDVAMVVCSDAAVLHFHSRIAAEAASSAGVPGAAVAGAASVTLRYAEHSVVPMTLAMMHTYLVGGGNHSITESSSEALLLISLEGKCINRDVQIEKQSRKN